MGFFTLFRCSPSIDIGDSLDGLFHFDWPYCYKVLNITNDEPIPNAKTTAIYLNQEGENIQLILITNSEGTSCHDWYDFIYAEISADGFETLILDNGFIPTTVKLIPL
ncbi:hypothetical protein GCM10023330_16350 [Litoribaculum gwangyangense]|uniref:Uncharacterized protein n=2 Tax=Litoribaculum gwangyangense TaxID=1130722 RepID=A0ABP9CGV4_9FLAO